MDKTSLGDRMKGYEDVYRHKLVRRTPVVIRIDGRAFHTYTRDMHRPFDDRLMSAMNTAALYCVQEIEGCKFAYVQSDEISLLLTDYAKHVTQPWFGYIKSKIETGAVSIATAEFNYQMKMDRLAYFDARSFNLPREEVVNYFIWRQQDWTRNSIQSVANTVFSPKFMHGKNIKELQELLMTMHGINWNNYEARYKRGRCITINYVDNNIPIFTKDREFVQKYIDIEEEE